MFLRSLDSLHHSGSVFIKRRFSFFSGQVYSRRLPSIPLDDHCSCNSVCVSAPWSPQAQSSTVARLATASRSACHSLFCIYRGFIGFEVVPNTCNLGLFFEIPITIPSLLPQGRDCVCK